MAFSLLHTRTVQLYIEPKKKKNLFLQDLVNCDYSKVNVQYQLKNRGLNRLAFLTALKVAVSRDFWPFLFHESNPSGPLINRLKCVFKKFVFAEIFEF